MDRVGDTAPKEYLALFLKKLDNPVDIWEHAFRNQLSDKAKNLLFILTTMPIETRINDVEKAFRAFHNLRCSKYSIAHSESDFQKALKELGWDIYCNKASARLHFSAISKSFN